MENKIKLRTSKLGELTRQTPRFAAARRPAQRLITEAFNGAENVSVLLKAMREHTKPWLTKELQKLAK